MIGLFAFFYGTLHLLTYVILDRFAGLGKQLLPASLQQLAEEIDFSLVHNRSFHP